MVIAHTQVVLPYFVLSFPIHQLLLPQRTRLIKSQLHGLRLQLMEAQSLLTRST